MLDVYIRSDLIDNGYTECGSAQEKSEFYIIAESETGQRIRLQTVSITNRHCSDDQCIQYLEHVVTKIKNHIAAGGKLNADCWEEIDPCYGSQRYIDLDNCGFFYRREKLEDSYRN